MNLILAVLAGDIDVDLDQLHDEVVAAAGDDADAVFSTLQAIALANAHQEVPC
jgi:hypothetical protein